MRQLTVGEWTSEPMSSRRKDIVRGVAVQGVLWSWWGLSVDRWIQWGRGWDLGEVGQVGSVVGIERKVRAACITHGRVSFCRWRNGREIIGVTRYPGRRGARGSV